MWAKAVEPLINAWIHSGTFLTCTLVCREALQNDGSSIPLWMNHSYHMKEVLSLYEWITPTTCMELAMQLISEIPQWCSETLPFHPSPWARVRPLLNVMPPYHSDFHRCCRHSHPQGHTCRRGGYRSQTHGSGTGCPDHRRWLLRWERETTGSFDPISSPQDIPLESDGSTFSL